MKVGILTFHCAPSYGAFFQAYALAKAVRSLGHDAEVIDYMPAHRRKALEISWRYPRRSLHRFGLNRVAWLSHRERTLFEKAARKHMPISRKRFDRLEDLRHAAIDYDACIVGSDQIWNPDHTGCAYDPAYFAQFGPREMRRVSYAASFGGFDPGVLPREVKAWMQSMDAISVREASGADVVKREADRKAEIVLDPSLLLDPNEYPGRRKPVCTDDYVLVYNLSCDESFGDLPGIAAAGYGCRIVDLMNIKRYDIGAFPASPLDALDLVRNASFVLTNSFHGCVLSILHCVPFGVVSFHKSAAPLAGRVLAVLDRVGLADRYGVDDPSVLKHCLEVPILWEGVHGKLVADRARSLGVLDRFLENKGVRAKDGCAADGNDSEKGKNT